MLTLKSDMKSTYLLSKHYLCNVKTNIQNYRVGMKAGCHSRKNKMFPVTACLPLTFMLPLRELGTAVQE